MCSTKKVSIFLSYNRFDEKTADRIDKHFKNSNIAITRDIRDIEAWGSIRRFMESIRTQDFAILIISGKYLKSINCMYEVLEIMKEQKYTNKIFPLVVEKRIYDPLGRSDYIKYWQTKYSKFEESISDVDKVNAIELIEDLKKYRRISENIGEFMTTISDMNNPNESDIIKAIINNLTSRGITVVIDGTEVPNKSKLSSDEKAQYLKMIESLQNQLNLEKMDKQLLTKKLSIERKNIPPKLKQAIESEKNIFPEFHEINMHFAFVCDGMNITAGYLLHSLHKEAIKGSSPLALLCIINDSEKELGLLVAAVSIKLNQNNNIHSEEK